MAQLPPPPEDSVLAVTRSLAIEYKPRGVRVRRFRS